MNPLIYRKVLIALAAVTLYSEFLAFLMASHLIPFAVSHFVLAFSVACIPLLACTPDIRSWPWAVTAWCFSYLTVILIFFLRPYVGEGGHELFRDKVFSVFFLVVMVLVFADSRVHRFTMGTVASVVLVSVAINIYEVFFPLGEFSVNPGRSAGFYLNANKSGAALLLGMIVGLGAVSQRWQIPFSLAVGVGILTTFSRSAIVAWILLVPLVFALRYGTRSLIWYCLATGLVGLVIIPYAGVRLLQSLENSKTLNQNAISRVSMEVGTESDESRSMAARLALQTIADHPLFGKGTGASNEPPFDTVGPHNTYLALMIDHGILGMCILPILLWAATRGATGEIKPFSVPIASFLTYWGLFSHNLLEEKYILFILAYVANLVASSRAQKAIVGRATI